MKGRRIPLFLEIVLLLLVIVIAGMVLHMAGRQFYRAAYPTKYVDIVLRESARNGLPPSLLFAVIRTESGFDPSAQSSIPARGLMQITEETFDWIAMRTDQTGRLRYDDLFDGETNIAYGAAGLRLLMEDFGSLENALCAYHAGWGSVDRWLENPEYSSDGRTIDNIPFGDTSRYVDKVQQTIEIYRRLYDME